MVEVAGQTVNKCTRVEEEGRGVASSGYIMAYVSLIRMYCSIFGLPRTRRQIFRIYCTQEATIYYVGSCNVRPLLRLSRQSIRIQDRVLLCRRPPYAYIYRRETNYRSSKLPVAPHIGAPWNSYTDGHVRQNLPGEIAIKNSCNMPCSLRPGFLIIVYPARTLLGP